MGDRLVSRGHSVTQIRWVRLGQTIETFPHPDTFRYAGRNLKFDFETNVTVRTLTINNTGLPCRYINQRGEFDFQSRDIKLVSGDHHLTGQASTVIF